MAMSRGLEMPEGVATRMAMNGSGICSNLRVAVADVADVAEMLEKAEVRFQGLGLFSDLVEFVEADFNESSWVGKLAIDQFDAVVSGFAKARK